MNPRLFALFVAVIVVLSGAILVIGPPHAWGDGGMAPRREWTGEQGVLSPPPVLPAPLSPSDAVGRSEVAAPPEARVTAAATTNQSVPVGLVVTGVVRHSGDEAPAPNVELILEHVGGLLVVRADEHGSFETAAVVQPGLVEVRHRPSGPDGAYPMRLGIDPGTRVLAGDAGGTVQIDVTLERPEAILLVDVVHLDGRAAPGASVELEQLLVLGPDSERQAFDRAVADAQGRARFALYAPKNARKAGVIARLGGDGRQAGPTALCSDFRLLEVPLDGPSLVHPVRLVLDAPASIAVRLVAADGSPARDRFLSVDDRIQDLGWWTGPRPRADENGEVEVAGLPAGTYRISVADAPTVDSQDITLSAAERGELTFTLPVEQIRLAVEGRLVDADGDPLPDRSVSVRFGGSEDTRAKSSTCSTDESGRFLVHAEPCETVTVTPNRGVFSDVYEPAGLEVPFGATGVNFRRVLEVATQETVFEILDSRTGALVPDVLVMTYRAPDLGDYSFHRAKDGRAAPLCPVHSSTTLVLEAAGYRRKILPLAPLLEPLPDGGLHRVEIERGLLRTIRVQSRDEDGAVSLISGARVRDGGRLLGATDEQGRFEVDLELWPENGLAVESDGRATVVWRPSDGFAELEPALVELSN